MPRKICDECQHEDGHGLECSKYRWDIDQFVQPSRVSFKNYLTAFLLVCAVIVYIYIWWKATVYLIRH